MGYLLSEGGVEVSVVSFPRRTDDEQPPPEPPPPTPSRPLVPFLFIYIALMVAIISPDMPHLVKLALGIVLTILLRRRGVFDD